MGLYGKMASFSFLTGVETLTWFSPVILQMTKLKYREIRWLSIIHGVCSWPKASNLISRFFWIHIVLILRRSLAVHTPLLKRRIPFGHFVLLIFLLSQYQHVSYKKNDYKPLKKLPYYASPNSHINFILFPQSWFTWMNSVSSFYLSTKSWLRRFSRKVVAIHAL